MKISNSNDKYIIKVKNGAAWKNHSKARLQISVGQLYHENEKLQATIRWATNNFEKVTLCVNDTLQRHNLLYRGFDEDSAFRHSESKGREWIERNYQYWKIFPNVDVVRWDFWRAQKDFLMHLDSVKLQYQKNFPFRVAVDEEMQNFWDRKKEFTPDDNFENFSKHSVNYLLEEIAVFNIMFKQDDAVDVYPGSTLLPCKLNEKEELGQRGYTRIDFRRTDNTKKRKHL